jgi:hypothetical protein
MILISWNWQLCLNPTHSLWSLDLYVDAVDYLQLVSACKQDLPCLILQEWKSFDQDATLVGHEQETCQVEVFFAMHSVPIETGAQAQELVDEQEVLAPAVDGHQATDGD